MLKDALRDIYIKYSSEKYIDYDLNPKAEHNITMSNIVQVPLDEIRYTLGQRNINSQILDKLINYIKKLKKLLGATSFTGTLQTIEKKKRILKKYSMYGNENIFADINKHKSKEDCVAKKVMPSKNHQYDVKIQKMLRNGKSTSHIFNWLKQRPKLKLPKILQGDADLNGTPGYYNVLVNLNRKWNYQDKEQYIESLKEQIRICIDWNDYNGLMKYASEIRDVGSRPDTWYHKYDFQNTKLSKYEDKIGQWNFETNHNGMKHKPKRPSTVRYLPTNYRTAQVSKADFKKVFSNWEYERKQYNATN